MLKKRTFSFVFRNIFCISYFFTKMNAMKNAKLRENCFRENFLLRKNIFAKTIGVEAVIIN